MSEHKFSKDDQLIKTRAKHWYAEVNISWRSEGDKFLCVPFRLHFYEMGGRGKVKEKLLYKEEFPEFPCTLEEGSPDFDAVLVVFQTVQNLVERKMGLFIEIKQVNTYDKYKYTLTGSFCPLKQIITGCYGNFMCFYLMECTEKLTALPIFYYFEDLDESSDSDSGR